MIHRVRDWEAGETLVLISPHEETLQIIERNAIQFLKDLHGSDPAVVVIDVQVSVRISINPDKQSKWTPEIPTIESANMTYDEVQMKTVRKETLTREESGK